MADPHNHTHQQRRHTRQPHTRWATLATTALIATVLAIAATANAAEINGKSMPDHEADYTACLGPATDDAGFEDIEGLDDATDAINCLAYYGITTGRNGGTEYDPDSNVTRGQMALFLYRAAKAAGIDLMGGDMDAMYGDIDELSEERQAAIKALARNGILTGRNSMSFYPLEDITRAEMAVALVNLVDYTGAPLSKADGLFVLGDAPGAAPNDHFADARQSVPWHVDNAISAAYELGITTGYPNGADGSRDFRPHASVPRRNMASFIMRALGHSNLRPEGVTAQTSGGTVTVSVRNADFAPVVNQPIDAFKAATAYESRAFRDDGTCGSRTQEVEGSAKCQIDHGDPVTQSDGNIDLIQQDQDDIGEGLTVWAWAGAIGDKVGSDTGLAEVAIPKGSQALPAADSATVTTDTPSGDHDDVATTDQRRAHFGSTVTWTIQLQGGETDDKVDVGLAPGADEIELTLVREWRTGNDPAAGTVIRRTTDTVNIGADGSGTFDFTAVDSDTKNPGQEVVVVWTLSGAPSTITLAATTGNTIFSDAASKVAEVKVEVGRYQVAPGAAPNAAGAAVTVTLTDQYGDPVARQGVVLASEVAPTGAGLSAIPAKPRITGRNGSVRIGYSYSGGAAVETLTATHTHDPDTGDDDVDKNDNDSDDASDDVPTTGTAKAYWVMATNAATQGTDAVSVLAADLENDQIVVDLQTGGNVTPTSVNYDANDFFNVIALADHDNNPDTAEEEVTTPSTPEDFEAALMKALEAAAETDDDDQPTLIWSSYIYDDPSDIASFTLDTNPGS